MPFADSLSPTHTKLAIKTSVPSSKLILIKLPPLTSMKNGLELSLNIDIVQRLDVKVFIAIIQDFKKLKFIQLFSEFCSLQQLERKSGLIELAPNKQAEMETKKFSQNTGDTMMLVRAFKDNMQENRNLK